MLSNSEHMIRIYCIFFALVLMLITISGCGQSNDSFTEDSSITVSGKEYPSDTTEIVLSQFDSDDYSVFNGFKNLQILDVTALELSADDFEGISSQVGNDVNILWSVPFYGDKYLNTTSEISIVSNISSQDANAMKYFKNIEKLTITDAQIDDNLYAIIKAAQDNNPDVLIACTTELYGIKIDNSIDFLDLNNIQLESPDKLCLAIELFPSIKTIEMCNCGLSNEIMQGLREEYPDIKFVWYVRFMQYKVRTDIQVFSTLAIDYSRPGNSESFAPLFKYCTELRALDLGHMAITDISEIRNLKKLHTLILADNFITDISPLADLKELNYVELFQNQITDISPLLELPYLEDLNFCYNAPLENPTELVNCKNLKRLYISHCSLDWDEINTLKKGIPDGCEFNYTAANCVYDGWRNNSKNATIRKAFKRWRKVKEYPTWDNIIYY